MTDQQNENEDPETTELFALGAEDHHVISAVESGLRDLMRRPSLTPACLHYLSVALLALHRLPRPTPGVELGVSLILKFEDESSFIGFYIGGDQFRLDAGGSAYTPEVGGDSFSECLLEVGPHGFRESEGEWAISGWVERFQDHCNDPEWAVDLEWLGDESQIRWDEEPYAGPDEADMS